MPFSDQQKEEYRELHQLTGERDKPKESVDAGRRMVRLAETAGTLEDIFRAKAAWAMALICSGRSDRAFPEVAWCLAKLEEHSELSARIEAMARLFAMLLDHSRGNVTISRAQMDDLGLRFRKLLQAAGKSAKPYYRMMMSRAVARGDLAEYEENYSLYKTSAGQAFECPACVQNKLVYDAFQLGAFREAWEQAQPLVAGEMKCGEVPEVTYGALLRWLVEAGDLAKADQFHHLGITGMKRVCRLLDEFAPHVAYLIFRQRWNDVVRLTNELLEWTRESASTEAGLKFLYAVEPLPERCPEAKFKVQLSDGTRPTREQFREFLGQEIHQLAESLNARNGNSYASEGFAHPYRFPFPADG